WLKVTAIDLVSLAKRFADIFFLVDSGVSASDFGQVRKVLEGLVNQLNIETSAYRLGLAQYGQDIKVEFLLNAYKTKEEVQNAVKSFHQRQLQPNEPRNLGNALEYASANFFTSEAGSRADQGYQQYLVVLSGKDSDDPVYKSSRLIKSEGITVVGVSLGASLKEMRLVATPPYVYPSVTNIVPPLKAIIEKEEEQIILTGGETVLTILLLLISHLCAPLNIPNRVRVGIVLYNEKPTAQVFLDTFDDKNELLNFIKILPYRGGGQNTGAALSFTRNKVFIKGRGSRKNKGIQQVAMVITDSESEDAVGKAAANLRRAGVTVYAVGVRDANQTQLEQIASYPPNKHVYNVESFVKLKALDDILQKSLCHNILHSAIAVSTRRSDIKEGCEQTDEADIFFLIDSGSIYPNDFHDMKKFMIEFLHTFRIGPQHVRLGVAKYADSPDLEFDLTTYSDASALENAVENIKQLGGGMETGRALEFMGPLFDNAKASRGHKVPKYLIVITDGKSSDEVKDPAAKVRAQGVTIYAIGVKDADEGELQEIAGDPKRTFFVNNFDALRPIKDDIITDICSTDACKDIPGDLIFLIDSSGSIYPEDYKKMKAFMKSVISKSIIGKNELHVGVMQFTTIQQIEFPLNHYHSKEEMSNAINAMQQIGGGTLTGEAITQVSKYFDVASGGRPDLRQRLIVITDGEAQDEVRGPAQVLRDKGVVVYAIGMVDANTTQLLEITGSPDRMYLERDFDALKDLESQVALELCDPDRECKKTEKADIIFLVDGSISITLPKFRSMQRFMSAIVNQTTVGEDLTHFGVILYSTNPNSVFTLKKHYSKPEVLKAIEALKSPYGDTYTGRALTYSIQYFDLKYGGRAQDQVPQILMVITGGDATDSYSLAAPSKALRDKGITVFSIGVEGANKTQLQIMASGDTSRVFYVDNFNALETLYKNITHVLCTSTKPACEKQQADLVFLIDQSSSIQPSDYDIMKNFTTELVRSFEVSEDLVRVGLAQFSSTFQDQFYLNQFYTEDKVTKHILAMNQLGGGTNIGLALDSIRKYFEAYRGSRRSTGISQNLVLITDGESQDDVEDPADHLRALGIEVFAIGIGDVHDLELLQITGTPERLFTVQNFGNLENIKQKVVDTICESKRPRQPGGKSTYNYCTIDIAMGFDISQRTGAPGEVLVSGHPKLQSFLPEIAHYISSVQGLCCVDPPPVKTSIAYLVVGSGGHILDDFNFEVYSEEVLKKVMTLKLEEPTYFNSSMLKSFEQKFSTQSNAGVKVLVIFSDGIDDDVMELKRESELLALLTVALEGARDPSQLQMVEFGRGFGYKLPLSIGMPGIGSTILKQIFLPLKCVFFQQGLPGQKGYPGFPGEEGVAVSAACGVDPRCRQRPGGVGAKESSLMNKNTGNAGWQEDEQAPGRQGVQEESREEPGGDQRGPGGDQEETRGDQEERAEEPAPGGTSRRASTRRNKQESRHQEGDRNQRTSWRAGTRGDTGTRGRAGGPAPGGTQEPEDEQEGRPQGGRRHQRRGRSWRAGTRGDTGTRGRAGGPAPGGDTGTRGRAGGPAEGYESNCPTGARVAVVGYSAYTKYLIRFQDYHRKKQLIEAVKSIALERTANRRQLGAAMRFVGQHVFKHVRAGVMMRKVAVFLSNGPSQDAEDIITAVMEYRGLDIVPAVISLRNAPAVRQAMEVGLQVSVSLDPCKRSEECAVIQKPEPPQQVDVDLVMVADSSREMQADEFTGVQQLLGSVVDQLAVSQSPRQTNNQARVAVVQQSGTQTPKVEFGLQTYQDRDLMRSQIQKMQQQGGSSGVALFVVVVGDRYSRTQVEELASLPVQQHLIYVGRLKADEQVYSICLVPVSEGINTYPPPSYKQSCEQLASQQEGQTFINE
uniref:VWFA domain-containing protein n=1 Tax=Monopterus albus TaxID=43700 RepID=A0A3Q3IMY2_MONAL